MRCLSRLLICYMVFHMMIYSQDEPTLDGDLTDEFWLSASTFSDFLEYSPRIGSQAAEKTIVLLKPGNNFLYIGFKVYSAKPIIANVMERDQPLTDDDFIEIVIDSYNNHTDALSFQTNMLGTRVDYELSENVTVKNKSWNTIWDVETRRTDYGWSAEFRIPFASLRFQSSENVTMGFKFIRQLAADNSFVVYPLTDQNVDNALYNLNFAEPISLGNIDVKQRLLLSPYIVGNLQNRHDLNQPADAYTSSTELFTGKDYFRSDGLDRLFSNMGLDIKYKPNSSHTIDISLNTDYAQAEAEDRLINITRYSILQPEKREFFLENSNFFSAATADHIMFNSRNIGTESGQQVPLIGGIRLVGLSGGWQYGLLNMQSNGLASEGISAKNFSVARVTKQIKDDESYIGTYFTHKNKTETGSANTVLGLDAVIRFDNSFILNSFFANSSDRTLPSDHSNAFGFELSRYPQDGIEVSARYYEYQENFNPDLGFLPRRNYTHSTYRAGYRFSFSDSFLSRLIIGNYHTFYYQASSHQHQFIQHNMYYQFLFSSGAVMVIYLPMYQKDYVLQDWQFSKSVTVPVGEYAMDSFYLEYRSAKSAQYNYTVSVDYGDFYGGEKLILSGDLNFLFNQRFGMGLSYDVNSFEFPVSYTLGTDRRETISLYTAKIKYNLNKSMSLNAYLQLDYNRKELGSNLRFRYNFSEGNDLFLVYNQLLNTDIQAFQPEKPLIQNQVILLKYKYLLTI